MRVSYQEIYKENVIDLLGDLGKHLQLKTNQVRDVSQLYLHLKHNTKIRVNVYTSMNVFSCMY